MLGLEIFPSSLPINRFTIGADVERRALENFKFIKELVETERPPVVRLPARIFPNIGRGIVNPVNLKINFSGVVAISIPSSLASLTTRKVDNIFRNVYVNLQSALLDIFGTVPMLVIEPGTKNKEKGYNEEILVDNLREFPLALDQIDSWSLPELHKLGSRVFVDSLLLDDVGIKYAMDYGMYIRYREDNESQDTPVAANTIKSIPDYIKKYPRTLVSCRNSIEALKLV